MLRVFLGKTGQRDPLYCPQLLSSVPLPQKERILSPKSSALRRARLASLILLREILPRFGIDPDTVTRDAHGRPRAEGICLSLSHSGDFLLLALSEHEVGCDIEEPRRAPWRVAARCFTPVERDWVKGDDDRFFRVWTMKESAAKLTGKGLGGLSRLETDPKSGLVRDNGVVLPGRVAAYRVFSAVAAVCAKERWDGKIHAVLSNSFEETLDNSVENRV